MLLVSCFNVIVVVVLMLLLLLCFYFVVVVVVVFVLWIKQRQVSFEIMINISIIEWLILRKFLTCNNSYKLIKQCLVSVKVVKYFATTNIKSKHSINNRDTICVERWIPISFTFSSHTVKPIRNNRLSVLSCIYYMIGPFYGWNGRDISFSTTDK